ncbi:MAG TPA: hypothetical protein PLZ16_07535, partial [Gammaproteobacteria bacterium]|nr:hypothetical protein [Gammaproteobacteria bacterium]
MQKVNRGKLRAVASRETILYTLPALVLVALTIYVPFVLSGYYSLTEWNGIAKEPVFIGFENFKNIFAGNPAFLSALWFTTKYAFFFIILSNIGALTLAVALTRKYRLANTLRGMFFVPYIMSMTIVGFIWKFIFTQGFAKLAEFTGWGIWNLSWLGDANIAFWSVVIVGVWQSLGFYIVLYIAGLQAVPPDVLEAARIESGRLTFDPRNFSIPPVILDVIDSLEPLAREKNLELKFERPAEPVPDIYADPWRVEQILINLLSNAIKYTETGKVWVECGVCRDEPVPRLEIPEALRRHVAGQSPERRYLRGLYSGGTLCYETLFLLRDALDIESNVAIKPELKLPYPVKGKAHCCVDLGE